MGARVGGLEFCEIMRFSGGTEAQVGNFAKYEVFGRHNKRDSQISDEFDTTEKSDSSPMYGTAIGIQTQTAHMRQRSLPIPLC
jgi:hypothetical protein